MESRTLTAQVAEERERRIRFVCFVLFINGYDVTEAKDFGDELANSLSRRQQVLSFLALVVQINRCRFALSLLSLFGVDCESACFTCFRFVLIIITIHD